ncbi:FAD-dependent oxidoreductase [Microbacterium phyllosphaerae]|uniref:FAD-dependent oxidoreductase n=1 Tax=Microbacterium phyllosphaerae TaxID=124798 RepID=UPI000EA037E6|nr:NAD(P)/FAD-dependent oxidoreductase [Microbacterium phyllosphaerae]
MPKALIIGGGVAGPATALFLQCAGWEVEIFEAHSAPDPFGGLFLNVATNGLAVLDQLGLRERLVADGHLCPRMVMVSGRGRPLGVVPNGPAADPDRGSVVVRRSWLHEVLHDAVVAAGIHHRFGARLLRVEEHADRVVAHFADGSTASGDVLVGADGVGSVVRTTIDPDAPPPASSGLISVGGFSRVPGLAPTPGEQYMVFGARSFFGYLVRDDGTVYWFANVTDRNATRDDIRAVSDDEWLRRLRVLHADDPQPVPRILDHVEGEIGAYPLADLTHVPHWHRGRLVAVGDAVHATSPSAGQGASLALEDAISLARHLRDDVDHEQAFAGYESDRRPRAEEVVAYARAVNRNKRVTKSRLGVALRDAMLPLFLRNAASDTRNDHLYNHVIRW